MPWIVGLDEAGYGPNLGPLVQAAVAVRVPDGVGCLWDCLKDGVRRASETHDSRVLIDDSKLAYAGPNGLAHLERTVVGTLGAGPSIGQFLHRVSCGSVTADLVAEPWYSPEEAIPVVVSEDDVIAASSQVAGTLSAKEVTVGVVRTVATTTPRFNGLLDRWESKAAVLAQGVIALLGETLTALQDNEPVTFVIDKQGGRNYYAAMVQTAFPDAWVRPLREMAESSEYCLQGMERDVRLIFRPRAESGSLPVALASMLAKYLREVFMRQFNRHWLAQIPGLKPTAGYPGDAKRFFDAIRPAMERLNVPESAVWRRK
jgi:hypothetical protein